MRTIKTFAIAVAAAALLAPAAQAAPTNAQLESAIVQQIGSYRAAQHLPALKATHKLDKAAAFHTADMLAHDFFAHEDADGGTFSKRVWRFTNARSIGEILGMAQGISPEQEAATIMSAWLHSAPHKANLDNPKYQRIGISRQEGTFKGQATVLITVDFSSAK